MPTSPAATVLRQRARELRRLAATIGECRINGVRRRAGSDVWVGPTAARCTDDLVRMERRLLDAMHDLIAQAVTLERRADDADLAAIVAAP